MRMTTLLLLVAATAILASMAAMQTAALTPSNLRCEYAVDPIGLGEARPRLYWLVESKERAQFQTAYQVLAASSRRELDRNRGDLWDSGVVASGETTHIEYAGKPLESRQGVWWKVRVWDRQGRPSAWSPPAYFEIGLLSNEDWRARWAALPGGDAEEVPLTGAIWIWYPELDQEKNAPSASRLFRKDFALPSDKALSSATLVVAADNAFSAFVNGADAGSGVSWQRVVGVDVANKLRPGINRLAIVATNHGGPAALAAVLVVRFQDGASQTIVTDGSWRTAKDAPEGWKTAEELGEEWTSAFEIGKMGVAPWGTPKYGLPAGPAPLLRKEFRVSGVVRRARVYASALGLYELHIDGKRVGDAYLTPGWTDYTKRVQYQTYDVTNMLRRGRHAIGVVLGDGWYCGHVCWFGRNQYGPKPRALVQLEIEYEDGSSQVVASDRSWKVTTGPILESDLLMGEVYDARREAQGWSLPGYDDSLWSTPETRQIGNVPLVGQNIALVKKVAELKPKAMWRDPNGAYVFDLGQNMVGWARLRVSGRPGTQVTLRFAEVLNPDRTIYTANLRSAKQTDTYVLKGARQEIWEPRFTFHGFRYVEVSGYPGEPDRDAIRGIVVSSAIEPSGQFDTSSALLNQLQHNIVWGMMGNYLEVPTDCPQRDERLGWMGDAQVFIRTGLFNFNIAAFMTKWIQDVRDSQSEQGAYRDVAPGVLGENNSGAPAWGDAGVIVPWEVYRAYGDKRLLERHYDSMRKWIAYIRAENPDLIWTKRSGNNYGDWVSIGSDTPKEVLATAYFAYSTRLLSKIAGVLGRAADAAEYETLFQDIREAFNREFVSEDARVKGDTQTCYILALRFDLLPEQKRALAARYLAEDILEKRAGHLSTGFVGTGHIAPALSEVGRDDIAYRLLFNDTFPSWGYSIKNGATTIWERWDGWTEEKGFQDPGMNSFNHYAFGSIGEWMYENVAGIRLDPEAPAYKRFVIRPRPGGRLTRARGSLDTLHGRIESSWRLSQGVFTLELLVPANTEAEVWFPTDDPTQVNEGGSKALGAPGVEFVRAVPGAVAFRVGGGRYAFEVSGVEPIALAEVPRRGTTSALRGSRAWAAVPESRRSRQPVRQR